MPSLKRKRPMVEVEHDEEESDDEAELERQALSELIKQRKAGISAEADGEEGEESNDAEEEEDAENDNDDDDNDDEEMKPVDQGDKVALLAAIADLKAEVKDLPWLETVTIMAAPLNIEDPEDDLKRETLFYSSSLNAVLQGRMLLEAAGVAHRRPDDFFAEMLKSDDHMKKIKQQLIFEKSKMEAYANRRSQQEQKKFAKKVQEAKLKERKDTKKQHVEALDKWRSRNKGASKDDIAGDFENYFFGKGGKGGAGEGGKGRGGPSGGAGKGGKPMMASKKRMAADKKYGFMGKQARFVKKNDKESASDMTGFKPFSKGGRSGGGGAGGRGGKSPGKSPGGKGAGAGGRPGSAGAAKGAGKGSSRPGKNAREAKRQRKS